MSLALCIQRQAGCSHVPALLPIQHRSFESRVDNGCYVHGLEDVSRQVQSEPPIWTNGQNVPSRCCPGTWTRSSKPSSEMCTWFRRMVPEIWRRCEDLIKYKYSSGSAAANVALSPAPSQKDCRCTAHRHIENSRRESSSR